MAIQFYLTSAGRNAALNAASLGLNVSLTHIAVGSGKYDPSNAMALTNSALVSEIERYPLNGGSVEPISHTLRFIANIEPTQTADGYEIGLITDQGVLFAIAATTSNTPLIRLVANIVSIVTFGMILSNLNLSNLIISIDPNTPICVALMNQHLDHPDPHTQYLLKTDFNAGVIALQNNKYDKTGGELNGNILLKGYLELTGGRTVAKLYAADFLRLELNHPLLINDAVNVSNVVAATDLTVSDNGSTSITHSNIGIEGNFVRFSSARDKYVFDKPIHAPSFVGGNVSIAANGYTSLPNGLIMQWGRYDTTVIEGGVNVTFPIAFPNACLNVTATRMASVAVSTDADGGVYYVSSTTNEAVFNLQGFYGDSKGTLRGFTWMVIGF